MNIIFARVFKGAVWKLVFYLSSFLLNIVLANYLESKGSGPFFYLLNNLGTAALLCTFGLENSISYFYSKKLIRREQLTVFSIVWSIFTALLFWVFLQFTNDFYRTASFELPVALLVLYLFGATCTTFLSALEFAQHKNTRVNLVPALLNLSCVLYLILFNRFNLVSDATFVVTPILLVPVCTAVILIVSRIPKFELEQINWKNIPSLFWTYSLKVYLATLALGLFTRCDIWLVGTFCSDEELGNYIQTLKFAQLAHFVPLLASFSLFPSFTQHLENRKLIYHSALQLANFYFYLVAVFCIVINLFSFWLFPLVYGSTFNKMHTIFLLLTPGVVALASTYPFVSFYGASNRSLTTFRVATGAFFVILILNLTLLPLLGVYGAALSFSAANIYFLFRLFTQFRLLHPASFLETFSPMTLVDAAQRLRSSIKF